MKDLGHADRYLDYLKVDTDKDGSRTGFEDVVSYNLEYYCVAKFPLYSVTFKRDFLHLI